MGNSEIFKKNNSKLDIYSDLLNEKIYPRIKELEKNYNHLIYEDINHKIPNEKKYLIDNLHFTKEGNQLIAKILKDIIQQKIL